MNVNLQKNLQFYNNIQNGSNNRKYQETQKLIQIQSFSGSIEN